MRKWLFALIILAGSYIALSGEFLIENKGEMLAFVQGGFSSESETDYLRKKNQKLEIELLNLKTGNDSISGIQGVETKVFSVYPFSIRSEIIVNAGNDKGVQPGDAVLYGNALVGKVKKVGERISVVQTIFDSEFEIPVRIGEAETDALYVGGMNPRLNMIDSAEALKRGDIIISASPDFPYGLGMGQILEVSGRSLKEASIDPFFEIKKIRNVLIITR